MINPQRKTPSQIAALPTTTRTATTDNTTAISSCPPAIAWQVTGTEWNSDTTSSRALSTCDQFSRHLSLVSCVRGIHCMNDAF